MLNNFLHLFLQFLGKLKIILDHPLRIDQYENINRQVEIRIAISHHNIISSLCSLKSFFRTAKIQANCYAHIDDTVRYFDRLFIKYHLPHIRFVRYQQSNFPKQSSIIQKLQKTWQGQKLFGMVKHAQTPKVLVLDSDILFFRKPTEILRWIKAGKNNIFMEDTGSFVAFSKSEFQYNFHVKRIKQNINTGIIGLIVNSKLIDIPKIRTFMALAPRIINERLLPDYETLYLKNNDHIIEQTLFIYLLSIHSSSHEQAFFLLHKHKYVLYPHKKNLLKGRMICDPIAIHYAGDMSIKHRLFEDYFLR